MVDVVKISDWLQVVGIFGVIASLVFVGLQMKQTQDIALAGTYNARASQTIDMSSATFSTPQHFAAVAKIYSGQRDQLTAEEYVALEHYSTALLSMYENNHFQYGMGYLPEEHWQKNLKDIDCQMTEPFFSELAEIWPARENFRFVLNASIERGRNTTENCWVSSSKEPWPYFNPVE
jgi:hypothetical protein